MIRPTSPQGMLKWLMPPKRANASVASTNRRYPINPLDANPGVYFCGPVNWPSTFFDLYAGRLWVLSLAFCLVSSLPPLFVSCLRSHFNLVSSLLIPFRKLLPKIHISSISRGKLLTEIFYFAW
jgi:hypothetical protein